MPMLYEPVPEWLLDELTGEVEQVLLRLGITRGLDGFEYLTDAIAQTVQNPRRVKYITKELYPDLAAHFASSASCVERAMRTAVQRCWKYATREALEEVVGYHILERPTNSEFIALVANYIRHRA